MKTLETPPTLRCPTTAYPWHQTMPSVEEYFYTWSRDRDIKTDLVYLPIFWWNNANAQRARNKTADYFAMPEAQAFVDQLDPGETYFTLSQCDDGVYETLPDNVIVFSAGGEGDIPIPLLSDPHPPAEREPKTHLASFRGVIEAGGPVETGRKRVQSSWNPDGRGALIRREMRYLFWGITGIVVEDARGGTQAALDRFREMARRSTFGLCPRGYGKTSFRLYEMFYLDAVPVYIYDELWLPYMDVLDWTEFAVLCHKRELLGLREQLVRLEEDGTAEKMRGRRLALREDYFSHDGMCRQIVRYLESY